MKTKIGPAVVRVSLFLGVVVLCASSAIRLDGGTEGGGEMRVPTILADGAGAQPNPNGPGVVSSNLPVGS